MPFLLKLAPFYYAVNIRYCNGRGQGHIGLMYTDADSVDRGYGP